MWEDEINNKIGQSHDANVLKEQYKKELYRHSPDCDIYDKDPSFIEEAGTIWSGKPCNCHISKNSNECPL